jgi:hypothetical protein
MVNKASLQNLQIISKQNQRYFSIITLLCYLAKHHASKKSGSIPNVQKP